MRMLTYFASTGGKAMDCSASSFFRVATPARTNPVVDVSADVQISTSFGRSLASGVNGLIWTLATSALWREKNEKTISSRRSGELLSPAQYLEAPVMRLVAAKPLKP